MLPIITTIGTQTQGRISNRGLRVSLTYPTHNMWIRGQGMKSTNRYVVKDAEATRCRLQHQSINPCMMPGWSAQEGRTQYVH